MSDASNTLDHAAIDALTSYLTSFSSLRDSALGISYIGHEHDESIPIEGPYPSTSRTIPASLRQPVAQPASGKISKAENKPRLKKSARQLRASRSTSSLGAIPTTVTVTSHQETIQRNTKDHRVRKEPSNSTIGYLSEAQSTRPSTGDVPHRPRSSRSNKGTYTEPIRGGSESRTNDEFQSTKVASEGEKICNDPSQRQNLGRGEHNGIHGNLGDGPVFGPTVTVVDERGRAIAIPSDSHQTLLSGSSPHPMSQVQKIMASNTPGESLLIREMQRLRTDGDSEPVVPVKSQTEDEVKLHGLESVKGRQEQRQKDAEWERSGMWSVQHDAVREAEERTRRDAGRAIGLCFQSIISDMT